MVWEEIASQALGYAVGQVNRNMIIGTLYRGYQEGLSGAAMLRTLRASGFQLRTQTFYRYLRAAKAFQASEYRKGFETLTSPISSRLFGGGIKSAGGQFNSVVSVHYYEDVNGEQVHMVKDLFIRSEEDLQVQQVIQKAYDVWSYLQASERYPMGEPIAIEYVGTAA